MPLDSPCTHATEMSLTVMGEDGQPLASFEEQMLWWQLQPSTSVCHLHALLMAVDRESEPERTIPRKS